MSFRPVTSESRAQPTMEGAGVRTGVDLESLLGTSAWMAQQLGRPSPSAVVRALTPAPAAT